MLVKKKWLEVQAEEVMEVVIERVNILDRIRKSEAKDDEVIKVVEEMKKVEVKMLRDKEWKKYEGLMFKEEKIYVPKNELLRADIIRLYHNTPIGGHRGQ